MLSFNFHFFLNNFVFCSCTLSVVEKFKSGEIPIRPPAKAYANTLIRGLVKGGRFSIEEAEAYIDNAASKPL